jgi:hypothetical protein
METIVFKVQGSEPEPYTIEITPNPLTLSCTCMAAKSGLPCKHRLQIVSGYCDNLVEAPENYDEIIGYIREAVHKSEYKDVLEKYKNHKSVQKNNLAETEKLFKKYRDTAIKYGIGKIKTDMELKSATDALNKSIQFCIEDEAETIKNVKILQTLFVHPGQPPRSAHCRS